MERINRPIGRSKLQPHMTLQTLSRHIKQESEEGTSNQESKNIKKVHTHNGLQCIFGLTFRLQWIGIKVDNYLHYFHAFHKKPREHSNPFDKFSRHYLGKWFTSDGKLKLGVQKGNTMGESCLQSQNNTF